MTCDSPSQVNCRVVNWQILVTFIGGFWVLSGSYYPTEYPTIGKKFQIWERFNIYLDDSLTLRFRIAYLAYSIYCFSLPDSQNLRVRNSRSPLKKSINRSNVNQSRIRSACSLNLFQCTFYLLNAFFNICYRNVQS